MSSKSFPVQVVPWNSHQDRSSPLQQKLSLWQTTCWMRKKVLLCRGLDKPVLHLWSLRSSFPPTLPLSSVTGHILRYHGSNSVHKWPNLTKGLRANGSGKQCRHCKRRLSSDKSFTEKVSQEVTFSELKGFPKNKNVKILVLQFSKTLCHSASKTNKLKMHGRQSNLTNSWFLNISFSICQYGWLHRMTYKLVSHAFFSSHLHILIICHDHCVGGLAQSEACQ